MGAGLEVADIFRRHGPVWRAAQAGHLDRAQRRVMGAIEACRTAVLGGHVRQCADCGHTKIAYNSLYGDFFVKPSMPIPTFFCLNR